jgi:DNA repair photolyase
MIISASRRCDIPAYAMDWLMNRLAAGYCLVRNPFDARILRRVSLLPEDLDCLVFWTRDPRPLLPRIPELKQRGIPFYVQMTITGYPESIEPAAPAREEALAAFASLSERIGPRRLIWRYDPIFVAAASGAPLDSSFHRENFEFIAKALEGKTWRVIVSLLDEYRGTRKRLEEAGLRGIVFGGSSKTSARKNSENAEQGLLFGDAKSAFPPEPYPALLADIARIAGSHGLAIQACAEPYDLSGLGIEGGPCVDLKLIEEITGRTAAGAAAKDKGQRGACRCAPSVDIGAYGTCRAACAYCYARSPWNGAPKPIDPSAEAL